MRLACPACQATYDIPDNLLGPAGRRLRCARCAAEWQAFPPPSSDDSFIATRAAPPDQAAPAAADATAGAGDFDDDAPMAEASAEAHGPANRPARPAVQNAYEVRGESRTTHASRLERLSEETSRARAARRGGRAMVAVLWVLSFAVLGAGGWACYEWREQVMAAWPPSQRLYLAFGVR
jgi:predicted Zn finger-like uncharacterized protein